MSVPSRRVLSAALGGVLQGGGQSEVREPAPPTYGTSSKAAVPRPDGVRETWLAVQDAANGEIVTVVEILSPSNKKRGTGRVAYESKRLAVFGSHTSLVEIDLLRAGAPLPLEAAHARSDYRIVVSRAEQRPDATLHAFSVRDARPLFALPLREGDVEPEVHLRDALDIAYDTGSYDLCLDYRGDPSPPLGPGDAAWAEALLREAGKR